MEYILDIHPNFVRMGNELVVPVINGALAGIPIIILALFGMSYMKAAFSTTNYQPDYAPVVKAFITMIILFGYQEVIGVICLAISGICQTVPKTPSLIEEWQTMFSKVFENEWYEWLWAFSGTLEGALLRTLLECISAIVRLCLEFLRDIILVFLYVTGPIALMLSLIPGLTGTANTWFKGFITVQFWILTIRILDQMVSILYNTVIGDMTYVALIGFRMIAFFIVITLMYLMVPTLTQYVVQSNTAGNFVGALYKTGSNAVMTVLNTQSYQYNKARMQDYKQNKSKNK